MPELRVVTMHAGADPSIHSNTELILLWMDDKASSHCLKTGVSIDPSIQNAWIILHSFIHSGIFEIYCSRSLN